MGSITKICSLNDCVNTYKAKGLCNSHYMRNWRHNDPLASGKKVNKIFPGQAKTPEYRTWMSMKARCLNPNSQAYSIYGACGIMVCDRWLGQKGFENFLDDMGKRPSGLTLDRIDNTSGYSPKNCHWATRSIQQQNRGIMKTNTSGYIGVFQDRMWPSKWRSSLMVDGKTFYLGTFNDPEQAAIAYDKAVIFFRGNDGITNIL